MREQSSLQAVFDSINRQETNLVSAKTAADIRTLAAAIAHEINNPLYSIAVCAEALVRRLREDSALTENRSLDIFERYLALIVQESYRCKEIVGELQNFSRELDG